MPEKDFLGSLYDGCKCLLNCLEALRANMLSDTTVTALAI